MSPPTRAGVKSASGAGRESTASPAPSEATVISTLDKTLKYDDYSVERPADMLRAIREAISGNGFKCTIANGRAIAKLLGDLIVAVTEDKMGAHHTILKAIDTKLDLLRSEMRKDVGEAVKAASIGPTKPFSCPPPARQQERPGPPNTDVMVSLVGVAPDNEIHTATPERTRELATAAIRKIEGMSDVNIHAVRLMPKRKLLAVRVANPAHAALVLQHAGKWADSLAMGSSVKVKEYKVVAFRTPIDFEPTSLIVKETMHNANKHIIPNVSDILEVRWLNPSAMEEHVKNPSTKKFSAIVISVASMEVADSMIACGINFARYLSPVRRFETTEVLQCFNCQGIGHHSRTCPKSDPTCPRCAGPHRIQECGCTAEIKCATRDVCDHRAPVSCANCKGTHPAAFNTCPHKRIALEEARNQQDNQSAYFNPAFAIAGRR